MKKLYIDTPAPVPQEPVPTPDTGGGNPPPKKPPTTVAD